MNIKIEKDTLSNLHKTNNLIASLHMLTRVFFEVFLLAITYKLIKNEYYLLSIVLFWTTSVWHSFWGYAGISHELFHNRVFSIKKVNNFFLLLANALTWVNGEFFKENHKYHHSNILDHNDIEGNSIQNWSLLSIVSYLLIDFRYMKNRVLFTLKNSIGIIPKNIIKKIEIKKITYNAIIILSINLIVHIFIFLFFESILLNIYFFLLPFTGQIFNRMLAQSQHIGLVKEKDNGPLYNSRTIIIPKLISFLYAGMNYHCEHHLYPGIPYYNLEKLNNKLNIFNINYNQVSLIFFVKDFWILIKK